MACLSFTAERRIPIASFHNLNIQVNQVWVSLALTEIEPLLRLQTVNLIKLRSFGFDRWNSKYLKAFRQIRLLEKPATSCLSK